MLRQGRSLEWYLLPVPLKVHFLARPKKEVNIPPSTPGNGPFSDSENTSANRASGSDSTTNESLLRPEVQIRGNLDSEMEGKVSECVESFISAKMVRSSILTTLRNYLVTTLEVQRQLMLGKP